MAVCYRHPNRETGVSCSNCGKPICPDCMTATPVGMRCPDCSRQRTRVGNVQNIYAAPTATYVLIAICTVIWLGEALSGGRGSQFYIDMSLIGGAIGPHGDCDRPRQPLGRRPDARDRRARGRLATADDEPAARRDDVLKHLESAVRNGC